MTFAQRHRQRHAGFTLLELLVAISILALLAVFSWRALDAITRTSDALKLSGDRIDGVARVFAAFDADSQNAQSADLQPGVVRFTASGGSVDYRLDNGRLMRHLPGFEPVPIAEGIANMRVDLVLVATTPANGALVSLANATSPKAKANSPPPKVAAVRIVLDLADGGSVTRLLLLNSV